MKILRRYDFRPHIFLLYAALTISLAVISIEAMDMAIFKASKAFGVVLNLSYSFLAAYIFYLLTIVWKRHSDTRSVRPLRRNAMGQLHQAVENIISEVAFHAGTESFGEFSVDDLKRWCSKVAPTQQARLIIAGVGYANIMQFFGYQIDRMDSALDILYRLAHHFDPAFQAKLIEISEASFRKQFSLIRNISLGKTPNVGFLADSLWEFRQQTLELKRKYN